jgi:hypothetical protein
MIEFTINPDSHSKFSTKTENELSFEDGSKFKILNGTPILFGKDSIFNEEEILNQTITTQDASHLDTSSLKNYIRRKLLPSLCKDFKIEERYKELSKKLSNDSLVLIIGTGEKKEYYKEIFSHCKVITSDVHNAFKPDYIFDGHYIPFQNDVFDLVLAAQVIEHTINPWLFCKELQRVTKIGGLLQIEAPQNFPYHAEPYDFFRFTFTGMRSLFPQCEVVKSEITEGGASMVAVTLSNYIVNTTTIKVLRSIFLFLTMLFFGWIKYLDKLQSTVNKRAISSPKGYAFTFRKDTVSRKSSDLLKEFYSLNS